MASARPSMGKDTLATTDLGVKHTCPECGAKFYDLGKHPPVCPKCKTVLEGVEEPVKAKRAAVKEKAKVAAVAPSKAQDDDDDDDDDDEDDDDEDDDEDDEDDD